MFILQRLTVKGVHKEQKDYRNDFGKIFYSCKKNILHLKYFLNGNFGHKCTYDTVLILIKIAFEIKKDDSACKPRLRCTY